MFQIITPDVTHAAELAELAKISFIESHGPSAPEKDLMEYVSEKFTTGQFTKELGDSSAVFKMIYCNNEAVAYSKIIPNSPNPKIHFENVCRMDRLYILDAFCGKGLGKQLFNLNVELAKALNQKGLWLYVWTGNTRALNFYNRQGFKKIGDTDFKISDNHSNPNYWMYLEF